MLPEPLKIIYQKYLESGCRVSTDTRNIEQGVVFFCLKGANFNGNVFAEEALKKGASCVVCDEEQYATSEGIVLVNNALIALQQLALKHCLSIPSKKLIIGGSNGKTTTKELCYAVLANTLKTRATEGNLNNHIGVPLTLLKLNGTEEAAIIEMGTNHPGEMKVLCDIAIPDFGIITNIGKEHLEGFGSIEAIAREESEVFLALQKSNGTAIVNNDDPWLSNMAKRIKNTLTVGIQNDADLKGEVIQSMPGLAYKITYQNKTYSGESNLGGAHNLYNILFAIATGILMDISIENAIDSIRKYVPKNNRSEWRNTGDKRILLDAYNANPSSMEATIKEFAKLKGSKAVLLGDMLELGEFASAEHKAILDLCKTLKFEEMFFSGNHFFEVSEDDEKNKIVFENTEALLQKIPSVNHLHSDWVLIKGSRGMRMERLCS